MHRIKGSKPLTWPLNREIIICIDLNTPQFPRTQRITPAMQFSHFPPIHCFQFCVHVYAIRTHSSSRSHAHIYMQICCHAASASPSECIIWFPCLCTGRPQFFASTSRHILLHITTYWYCRRTIYVHTPQRTTSEQRTTTSACVYLIRDCISSTVQSYCILLPTTQNRWCCHRTVGHNPQLVGVPQLLRSASVARHIRVLCWADTPHDVTHIAAVSHECRSRTTASHNTPCRIWARNGNDGIRVHTTQ